MINENALRQICKNNYTYDICFDLLKDLVVFNEKGEYLLSSRKNAPLFACIVVISNNYRHLLKRAFSKRELIYFFSAFLDIKQPSRISSDGSDFSEFEKEAQLFLDLRIKELSALPKL